MKKILFPLLLSLVLALQAGANEQDSLHRVANTTFVEGIFNMGNWCRPFWADMHSTITRAEVAYALNSPEYDWAQTNKGYRPYVFANLGIDVPVWAGVFANRKYGFSLTLPYLVDVWLDMFERTTAPVINTGYRFGLFEFNFIHHLDKTVGGIKNYSLKYIPFKHECSHIGDDLTVMRARASLPLDNLNISYNYWQIEATINDPEFSTGKNHSLRAAMLMLYDSNAGWYSVLPESDDASLVIPTKRPFEFWVQYQYQSKTNQHHFQWLASLEVRGRVRYHYPMYWTRGESSQWKSIALEESFLPGLNLMLGVRYRNPEMLKFRSVGVGLRAYGGTNPYGQFRSIPAYSQLGIALMIE